MLIESNINLLLTDADKASDKAEEFKSFPHITKANALQRRAKDKGDELKVVRKELSDTKHLLTKCDTLVYDLTFVLDLVYYNN